MTKATPWKGYTLEELAQRRAINAIKQEMTLEQMTTVYSQIASGNVTGNAVKSDDLTSRLSDGLSKIISLANYGSRALQIIRQVKDIVNQFRTK